VRANILSDPAHPFLYRPYQINDPSVGVITQYVSPVADELAKVPGQDKSDAIFVRLNGYGSLVPISAALDWLADVVLNGARGRPCSDSPQQLQVAAAYGQLPLSFETNEGQSGPRVRHLKVQC
jgi:hypothetical protein